MTTAAQSPNLAALEPGELLVRVLRGQLTIPPDHIAIAKANRRLANWSVHVGTYQGAMPTAAQRACLEGI